MEKISEKNVCGDRDKTVSQIISECSGLTQRFYKVWRHDKIGQVSHWKLYQRFSLGTSEK